MLQTKTSNRTIQNLRNLLVWSADLDGWAYHLRTQSLCFWDNVRLFTSVRGPSESLAGDVPVKMIDRCSQDILETGLFLWIDCCPLKFRLLKCLVWFKVSLKSSSKPLNRRPFKAPFTREDFSCSSNKRSPNFEGLLGSFSQFRPLNCLHFIILTLFPFSWCCGLLSM